MLFKLLNKYEKISTWEDEEIIEEEIKQQIKRIPNRKSLRIDIFQSYFIEYIDVIQEYIIEIIQ